MTPEEMKRLVGEINRDFAPPFLRPGLVRARLIENVDKPDRYPVIELKIGPRDIWIDKHGAGVAAGTNLRGWSYARPRMRPYAGPISQPDLG